jgi:hypothetical protein
MREGDRLLFVRSNLVVVFLHLSDIDCSTCRLVATVADVAADARSSTSRHTGDLFSIVPSDNIGTTSLITHQQPWTRTRISGDQTKIIGVTPATMRLSDEDDDGVANDLANLQARPALCRMTLCTYFVACRLGFDRRSYAFVGVVRERAISKYCCGIFCFLKNKQTNKQTIQQSLDCAN